MAGIASAIYKQAAPKALRTERPTDSSQCSSIFRQNQVFLATVFAGAFAFEMGFDRTIDKFWDFNNKGRQWKDIKGRYLQHDDE